MRRCNIPIGPQLNMQIMAPNGLAAIVEAITHTHCTPVRMDGLSGHGTFCLKETSTGRRVAWLMHNMKRSIAIKIGFLIDAMQPPGYRAGGHIAVREDMSAIIIS